MNRSPRVLIIEDNRNLAIGLQNNLELEGYRVEVAEDAESGLIRARAWAPHLIILDLMLPDRSGSSVLSDLRRAGSPVPVLILTARGEEADKVAGFNNGADDYVTKPFGLLELLGRVKALLRRAPEPAEDVSLPESLLIGDILVATRRHLVFRDGVEVLLRPKEFDLLIAIVKRNGNTVSKGALLKEVWGYREQVVSRTVDTHVGELRRKLETDPGRPQHILTVRKAGYRLGAPFVARVTGTGS
ncbi:MAG: response regulator transcription factor [Gemmatimonas sp.]